MKLNEFIPQEPVYAPDAFIEEANTLRTTSQEAADANWELARMSAGHQALERFARIKAEEGYMERAGRNKVDVEQLNREFKDQLIEPFKEPEYYSVAKIKAETQQKQKLLSQLVEAGPQDMWTKGKHFVAGMAAHVIDPAETGLMLVTAGGFRAFTAGMAARSATARIGLNVAENITGAALAESIVAAAATEEGTPYTSSDFVINTIGSALAFEGLRFGADRLAQGAKGFATGFRAGYYDEVIQALDRTATAQLADGKRVDVSAIMEELELDVRNKIPMFEDNGRLVSYNDVIVNSLDGTEFRYDLNEESWVDIEGKRNLTQDELINLYREGGVTVSPKESITPVEATELPIEEVEPVTRKIQPVEKLKQISPEEKLQRMQDIAKSEQDPKRSILYDENIDKILQDTQPTAFVMPKAAEVRKLEQEYLQQLDELLNQKIFDEDEVVTIKDDLKAIDDDATLLERAYKAATVCAGRK